MPKWLGRKAHHWAAVLGRTLEAEMAQEGEKEGLHLQLDQPSNCALAFHRMYYMCFLLRYLDTFARCLGPCTARTWRTERIFYVSRWELRLFAYPWSRLCFFGMTCTLSLSLPATCQGAEGVLGRRDGVVCCFSMASVWLDLEHLHAGTVARHPLLCSSGWLSRRRNVGANLGRRAGGQGHMFCKGCRDTWRPCSLCCFATC